MADARATLRALAAAENGCIEWSSWTASRRFKNSPSAPPAPDYTGMANAQAAANLANTRLATKANRVDQYTPYGSLVYTQGGGDPVFDQSGYDAAMKSYQDALKNPQSAPPQYGWMPNPTDPNQMTWGQIGGGSGSGTAPAAPNRNDFMISQGDPDRWSSTISLSPVGQQLLDYQNQASLGLGSQLNEALGRVDSSLSKDFDFDSIGALSDEAYNTETARLDPQWQQMESQYDQKLANQGIVLGSEAYQNAMRQFQQGRNDAYSQARKNAFGMMPQTFQLAQSIRNQPLNELNALRTGSQVTNPTFNNNIPQQQTAPGANLLGAAQAQYGAANDAYNSQVGQDNAFMSGLMGLGGSILGSPWAGKMFGF